MTEFFQLIIHSNIINFFIVLALMVFLVKKLNVNSKIESLRDEIKTYVDSSENEKKYAEKSLEDIKAEIEKLPAQIQEIKTGADINIKNIGERIKAGIASQKQDISNNAERIMQLEIKKFKAKLTNKLSEKSIEVARENAIKQLENNKELHNEYIENAISELDRIVL